MAQSRLQVDGEAVALQTAGFVRLHVTAGTEHQRTGHAKVGEQHFAQLFKDDLAAGAVGHLEGDVL